MQSAKFSEIFKRNKMGVAGRYSLYKDLKPKVSNLMVLPGYLVFIYFIVSLLTTVPVMYPQGSLAYNLLRVFNVHDDFPSIHAAVRHH